MEYGDRVWFAEPVDRCQNCSPHHPQRGQDVGLAGRVGPVDPDDRYDGNRLAAVLDASRSCGAIVKLGGNERQPLLVTDRQHVRRPEA